MHALVLLIIIVGLGYAAYKLRAMFGRSGHTPVGKTPADKVHPADPAKTHQDRPGRPEDKI
jgi:hypothetical protein